MIEPHGTQDDVGWKTISTITEFLFHTRHCRGKLGNLTEPLGILRAPGRYRNEVDRIFQRPRNRRQGLPDDEARQFFRSHKARLRNRDASRLTREEKRTLIERGTNLRVAEKAYIQLQRVALGLARAHEPERSQSPEMDR